MSKALLPAGQPCIHARQWRDSHCFVHKGFRSTYAHQQHVLVCIRLWYSVNVRVNGFAFERLLAWCVDR
jgi:hypothetical protein